MTHSLQLMMAGTAIVLVGVGSYIYYETDIRHTFYSAKQTRHLAAQYERRYKRYQRVAQPRITALRLSADIFPKTHHLLIRGTFTLRNTTAQSIDTVHVELPIDRADQLTFNRPITLVHADTIQRHYVYCLGVPLTPGDSMTLIFTMNLDHSGFTRDGPWTDIVENGTFVNSQAFLPSIGYDPSRELESRGEREDEGLGERVILPASDPYVRNQTVARDADFVDFDATVSTSSDQIAIAPGYLQREWARGNRRYFHYRMDAPILHFFALQSGRYSVLRDRWHDVAVEVYYDPAHLYNLSRMVAAIKAGLEYYTVHFGPYQHRQIRIIEFPRYATFAQSFPNTIPFSEAIGFIARVGKSDIDYPFYVTAHEVAHQWWGHQVVAAQGPGSTLIEEAMAEYSALMVMEQAYGRHRIGQFLRYERDRYLADRSRSNTEQPLSTIRGGMNAYTKGGLAMYALRGYIGEAQLNAALKSVVSDRRFRGPPYTTAADLIATLRAGTPDSLQSVITDLFERVTLYDLQIDKATMTRRATGQYEVTVRFKTKKAYADSAGRERAVPMREWVDVGVYAGSRTAANHNTDVLLAVQPVRVVADSTIATLVVNRRPTRIVLDPLVKLMNRSFENEEAPVIHLDRDSRAPSSH